jgi:hypothetical protein
MIIKSIHIRMNMEIKITFQLPDLCEISESEIIKIKKLFSDRVSITIFVASSRSDANLGICIELCRLIVV